MILNDAIVILIKMFKCPPDELPYGLLERKQVSHSKFESTHARAST